MTTAGSAVDKIQVEKVIPLSGTGSLKAFATVRLGAIVIHDFRIIQQAGKDAWVSPPQKEVNKDGARKWFPIVELSDELRKIVEFKILEAWRQDHERWSDPPGLHSS
jgi:DNA-binding cell septation regulator SpoVG